MQRGMQVVLEIFSCLLAFELSRQKAGVNGGEEKTCMLIFCFFVVFFFAWFLEGNIETKTKARGMRHPE